MKHAAFTLVELSIVLIIIALIIAAALTGGSLVRTYQIRALVTQVNEIETATTAFFERYNALPGDFADGQQVWGTASCPTSGPTCRGNGDGLVDTSAPGGEAYVFFMHLSLAGLIDGRYHGYNLPKVKFHDTYMGLRRFGGPYSGTPLFSKRGTALHIGFRTSSLTYLPLINAFSGQEMYEIDLKMDDGVAYTGKVYGYSQDQNGSYAFGPTTGCPAYSAGTTTRDYNKADNTPTCLFTYWMQNGF